MTERARARPVRWFGDGALVVELASVDEAHGLARAMRRVAPAGVDDVVVGYRSVTVVGDPDLADLDAVAELLATVAPDPLAPAGPRRHDVSVAFDGPDLDEVAAQARTSAASVVEQLTETALTVAFVGFLPGFAYLEGLPISLAGVPRRRTPRPVVPAGSVAVAGGFAGIYPHRSPGGWHLVGRTRFTLFDPDAEPFATLAPGDVVRLVDRAGVEPPASGDDRGPLRASGPRTVVVEAPGLLSMVQDLGRVGAAHLGVPRAGAADVAALVAANRLVGNADGDAALEITATGPRLRFAADAHVAVTGGTPLTLDGRALEPGVVVPVAAGQTLAIGTVAHDLRSYLAVSGGFAIEERFGSRSSDVLTALGPGALRAGDQIALGPPTRPRGRLLAGAVHAGPPSPEHHRPERVATRVVRVLPGPDGPEGVLDGLVGRRWTVDGASDRMGVRLVAGGTATAGVDTTGNASDRAASPSPDAVTSRGMVRGAVQLPPGGEPVVLLGDHATVGGYRVVATAIGADLGVLGRCRPGDTLRFEPVDRAEAAQARTAARRALDGAVVGWYPARVD